MTYFWNGNRGGCFDERTEHYVEIPSDRVSFDERPAMKAHEITERTIREIAEGSWRFIRLNFPNGDMVGHTGNLDATVEAMEAVDVCIGKLLEAVEAAGGLAIVTADHGNADDMVLRAADGAPKTDPETAAPCRGRATPRTPSPSRSSTPASTASTSWTRRSSDPGSATSPPRASSSWATSPRPATTRPWSGSGSGRRPERARSVPVPSRALRG